MAPIITITKSTVKKKKPSSSTPSLQATNFSRNKDNCRISWSGINGCSNKRKADRVVPLAPDDGGKRQRTMDPSMRLKPMEQRWKRQQTGALKTTHVQPNKKQGTTTTISVPSRRNSGTIKAAGHQDSIKAAHHQDSIKAKLSQGGCLISRPAGGIDKNKNAQEKTSPNSSFSCRDVSGDLVCGVNNNRIVDDDQVVKKALQAAKQTSRFAEIFSKTKEHKANLHKERDRQKREEEARKAGHVTEAEQLKKKEAAELREKEREAARIALQMLEKTVEFEDNLMILKELEKLSQCSPTYILKHGRSGPAVMMLKGLHTGKLFHPLQQLGLHLKDEFVADDYDDDTILNWEAEEGEILPY